MATYCFRCPECGQSATAYVYGTELFCLGINHVPTEMVRDYRAENVGIAVQQLKDERSAGGREGYDRMFLPSNDDFKGPGDPDGTSGMRAWRDQHEPKDTNKKPRWPGSVERKVM